MKTQALLFLIFFALSLHPAYAGKYDSSCSDSSSSVLSSETSSEIETTTEITSCIDKPEAVQLRFKSVPPSWPSDEWKKDAWSKDNDPYYTGSPNTGSSFNFGYSGKNLPRYQYRPPARLGNWAVTFPKKYEIPKQKNGETDEEYDLRRLIDLTSLPKNKIERYVTFAGSGSQSRVYFIHKAAPSGAELKKLYPNDRLVKLQASSRGKKDIRTARRELWAKENASEVIKLRQRNPWGKGYQKAIEQAKRDIIIQNIFKQITENFKKIDENGKAVQLVRIEPYKQSLSDLAKGVFRQNAVQCESAFQVAEKIKKAVKGDLLQKKYLVAKLKFKNIEEAKKDISLLEQLFRVSRPAIVQFSQLNHFSGPGARSLSGNKVSKHGGDYNHGSNVCRDPETGTWILIDQ